MKQKNKIKKAFQRVKLDVDVIRYDTYNYLRYLNEKAREQDTRIREIERRLSQAERIVVREAMAR
jgi:hypothetical protein